MAILSPFPKFRAFDQNGDPLAGGKLNTYEPGTLTPKATFTTAEGTVANPNPVILNAQGEADVWLDGVYRWILTDALDVQQWDIDQIGSTIGAVIVRPNATERILTAPDLTPQILQSDVIAANEMSPLRVLSFEYFGITSTLTLNPLQLRIKYNTTILWSGDTGTTQASDYVWKLAGTLLMRNAGRADMIVQLTLNPSPPGGIIHVLAHEVLSVDLSQSFAFALEAERNVAANVDATLFGSHVRIAG